MRDGNCIKCGGSVRQLTRGVYQGGGETALMVNDGSRIRRASSYETFLCTACGYWENYLSDADLLGRVRDGAGGWAPPR
jgi:hypothetical protein